ncbi:MAG: hypothetical protein CMJ18_10645 [Phycisphaeraceae bacterium]|nr:hypothetical protein [Phycisphaeraceae bacterium]
MVKTCVAAAVLVAALIMAPSAGAWSFVEEFDGETLTNNWAPGDNAAPDYPLGWQMPNGDEFAAGVGGRADGSFDGDEAGRLRVLNSSALPMIAALDFTPITAGTLDIGRMADGTGCCTAGGSSIQIRLLDSASNLALEVVMSSDAVEGNSIANFSQMNAGTFVTGSDGIVKGTPNGPSIVIDFNAATDTFTAVVTDSLDNGPINLGTTAFDNAVGNIARLELIVPAAADPGNPGIGTEINMTHVILTPEPASVAFLALGALMVARRRR